ncbi:MAG: thiolase domain-containing protein [Anaerolineae bacterium]
MRDVAVLGIGQTPIDEHWESSLRDLGYQALRTALDDARVDAPQMLFVGNMLSGALASQENLGALIADYAGFRGIEAFKVEAACASGAASVRMAWLAVAGGACDVAVALGVEKMTDGRAEQATAALAYAADAEYEGEHGISFVALNALLMQRYMHVYGYRHVDFSGFAVNAHHNATTNPNAMYPHEVTVDQFEGARAVASPITLMDSSGIGDGAAAVVLVPLDLAIRLGRPVVRVLASASAIDSVALHDRRDPLFLQAAFDSAQRAYAMSGIAPEDMDFLELHDAFTIMSALSLEACGFAARGRGVTLAMEGQIARQGRLPISTMGGLKARGHPVGATGVYQVVEAVQQLRGTAGPNQLPGARLGMTQNIGGSGANITTHILERTS